MHHFWQQVRKVRLTIILGLTMAILNAACDLFWPTIIATIVDDGIVPGNPAHIKKMLIVMVVVAVIAACVKYAKIACAITTGNRYSRYGKCCNCYGSANHRTFCSFCIVFFLFLRKKSKKVCLHSQIGHNIRV